MPLEVNVVCEQCGRFADQRTYVQLKVIDNPSAQRSGNYTFKPEETFDVVFCTFRCTKQYIEQIT